MTAVDGIDLDVREGDVYGFLGANGSGKTTTVRMLLGLVLATKGTIELLGESMPAAASTVLPRVGALVEGPGRLPAPVSGRANLATFDAAGRRGTGADRRSRITEVLEQVGLDPADKRPVRAYSLGMRQRLGLASALLRSPPLLVLDEPTNGLDPQGIREMRELLLALNAAGTTIFLSSHLLAEIEQMCTRVGVLDRGRLVLQEQLDTLTAPDRTGPRAHPRRTAGDRAPRRPRRRPEATARWSSAAPTPPRSTRRWSPPAYACRRSVR